MFAVIKKLDKPQVDTKNLIIQASQAFKAD